MLIKLIESSILRSIVLNCKPLVASMIHSVFVLNMTISSVNSDLNIELLFPSKCQESHPYYLYEKSYKISCEISVYLSSFLRDTLF